VTVPAELSAWDRWHSYDFMAIERRRNHQSHTRILEILSSQFTETPFSLLDVGVLSTVTLERIRDTTKLNARYTGIDVSFPIIMEARKAHPGVAWAQADINAIPFADSSFDSVLVRHVLEHVEDPVRAIRESARVSRRLLILCFFLPPAEQEQRRNDVYPEGMIMHNTWRRDSILEVLLSLFTTVTTEFVPDSYRANELFVCTKEPQVEGKCVMIGA